MDGYVKFSRQKYENNMISIPAYSMPIRRLQLSAISPIMSVKEKPLQPTTVSLGIPGAPPFTNQRVNVLKGILDQVHKPWSITQMSPYTSVSHNS